MCKKCIYVQYCAIADVRGMEPCECKTTEEDCARAREESLPSVEAGKVEKKHSHCKDCVHIPYCDITHEVDKDCKHYQRLF